MPRIPIPTFEPGQTNTPGASLPGLSTRPVVNTQVAEGLTQLGRVFQAIGEEDSRAWASKTASDDQLKWIQRLEEMKGQAQPGAPGFTDNALREFDDYSSKALANAPAYSRRFYEQSLNNLRSYVGQNAVGWQGTQVRKHAVDQYAQGLNADTAVIALDPSQYADKRITRLAVLSSSNLPPNVRDELMAKTEGNMAYAAGAATIDQDPAAARAAFRAAGSGQLTPGYEWISKLNADQVLQLSHRTQTQVDRIENHQRIEADRLDARATKAFKEMDDQAASPYPAKPEDVMRWAGAVAGNPVYEEAFRDRVVEMNQAQQLLSRPVAEQRAALAEAQRKLLTQGGNKQDAARLDRLSATIQANITAIQTDPLNYVQQRTGVTLPPVDLGTALMGEDASVIGPQIRDRMEIIRALQMQNPDQPVAMHPLLADEANALTQLFKTAPSSQKAQVLGTLYRAMGDSAAFAGAMDQINGTDPFMARMGQRAASFEQAKLTNNWFSADVMQAAGDVVGISLHGDEILRGGGKEGTLKFPVPKEDEFITALRDKVGNLYRGAGPGDSGGQQFTQDAYAIKAYYTGKAAQEGDLSGVVDSARLDQAIAAVVGQSVDYRGNTVLAPWGMDESDFLARANKAVFREISSRGMEEQLGRSMSSTGLIGIGAGTYAVTRRVSSTWCASYAARTLATQRPERPRDRFRGSPNACASASIALVVTSAG